MKASIKPALNSDRAMVKATMPVVNWDDTELTQKSAITSHFHRKLSRTKVAANSSDVVFLPSAADGQQAGKRVETNLS